MNTARRWQLRLILAQICLRAFSIELKPSLLLNLRNLIHQSMNSSRFTGGWPMLSIITGWRRASWLNNGLERPASQLRQPFSSFPAAQEFDWEKFGLLKRAILLLVKSSQISFRFRQLVKEREICFSDITTKLIMAHIAFRVFWNDALLRCRMIIIPILQYNWIYNGITFEDK